MPIEGPRLRALALLGVEPSLRPGGQRDPAQLRPGPGAVELVSEGRSKRRVGVSLDPENADGRSLSCCLVVDAGLPSPRRQLPDRARNSRRLPRLPPWKYGVFVGTGARRNL